MMSRNRLLFTFIVLTIAGGLTIGILSAPGAWYAALEKPVFNPPGWIFPPVWTLLYGLVGIAGARTWARGASGPAMRIWFVQIVLNFLWSPTFFTLHDMLSALIIILALLASILIFIALVWRHDRLSGLLFVPYALWVAFASLLNAALLCLAAG